MCDNIELAGDNQCNELADEIESGLFSSITIANAYINQLCEKGLNKVVFDPYESMVAFADLFDNLHTLVGEDKKYKDCQEIYPEVVCPCGGTDIEYWDTPEDEREHFVIQYYCNDCGRVINVDYRIVNIQYEPENDKSLEEENNDQ